MATSVKEKANIAVIGAGWWSQGWHIPHLHRNPGVHLIAIVDTSHHPKSSLNPNLEALSVLSDKYGATVFSSVSDLLSDPIVGPTLDGVLVATPHATHYVVGEEILKESQKRQAAGKSPIHILMEKRKSHRRLYLVFILLDISTPAPC
jgi:predicted dehydrogenase